MLYGTIQVDKHPATILLTDKTMMNRRNTKSLKTPSTPLTRRAKQARLFVGPPVWYTAHTYIGQSCVRTIDDEIIIFLNLLSNGKKEKNRQKPFCDDRLIFSLNVIDTRILSFALTGPSWVQGMPGIPVLKPTRATYDDVVER